MFTAKWIAKEGSAVEGCAIVRVPKNLDRIKFLQTIHTSIGADGALDMAKANENATNVISFALKHIDSVELIRKEDGFKVPSVEWLEYDIDGALVLREIGNFLIQGISLGKN